MAVPETGSTGPDYLCYDVLSGVVMPHIRKTLYKILQPKWKTLFLLGMGSILTVGAISLREASVNARPTQGFEDSSRPEFASTPASTSSVSSHSVKQESADLSEEWRAATQTEEEAQWGYILDSPLGIAALNQLAIEGFISPLCSKTFYINEQYGGFQSLMKVECPDPRGASTAVGYDEVHVIFNRFESNIEGFEIQRFGQS